MKQKTPITTYFRKNGSTDKIQDIRFGKGDEVGESKARQGESGTNKIRKPNF